MSQRPYGSFNSGTDSGPVRVHIKDEVFVSLYSPSLSRGCAAVIRTAQLNPPTIKMVFADVHTIFGADAPKDLQLKLVGPRASETQMLDLLKAYDLKVQGSVWREHLGTDVVFYPETGRLRVAKEDSSTPAQTPPAAHAGTARKMRVLIVDDSPTIHKLLTSIFSSDPEIEIVGHVQDPLKAEEMVITSRPDVITLDIHMPGLNGVDLLKQLFPKYKIPAVMITSVSLEEGPIVLEALSNGAVDYIRKPTLQELPHLAPELREKVKIAARANKDSAPRRISRGNFRSDAASAPAHSGGSLSSNVLVAIGSSTGGTQALESLLVQLPFGIPPILIVQHIPALFSSALARRLNEICPFEVKEAADGDQILPNRVLLAPGGKQMRVRKRRKETDPFTVEITDDSPVNRHKPSVDYLYDSIAEQKIPTIGVILTGMGNDGAKGLLNLRQTGARTIAQDEASCVVFGMPKEAIRLGAAQEVLSLEKIPAKLMSWLQHDHKVA